MTYVTKEQADMMALCKAFPELTFMEVMELYQKGRK